MRRQPDPVPTWTQPPLPGVEHELVRVELTLWLNRDGWTSTGLRVTDPFTDEVLALEAWSGGTTVDLDVILHEAAPRLQIAAGLHVSPF